MTTKRLYYIQCLSSYAGDYVLWWAKDGQGYTCDLNKAGLFSEAKARSQERQRPDVDKAWPQDAVEAAVQARVVTIGNLRTSMEAPALAVALRPRDASKPLAAMSVAELVEEARKLPPMTPEQREQQRQSFVHGNLNTANDNITRQMVAEAAERLRLDGV